MDFGFFYVLWLCGQLFVLATNSSWDETIAMESEAGRMMSVNSFVSWNGPSKGRGAVITVRILQNIDRPPRDRLT